MHIVEIVSELLFDMKGIEVQGDGVCPEGSVVYFGQYATEYTWSSALIMLFSASEGLCVCMKWCQFAHDFNPRFPL